MRGILMIESLYHQVVAGNKTQTRRSGGLKEVNSYPDIWLIQTRGFEGGKAFINIGFRFQDSVKLVHSESIIKLKSRYKIGEVLYLKEPSAIFNLWSGPVRLYKYGFKDDNKGVKWENKLFMPAKAARAFICITGIRCERLLDISEDDCVAEGIEHYKNDQFMYLDYMTGGFFPWEKQSFISLYMFANKISPKKQPGNPWVWVYYFKYLPDYKLEDGI